MIGIGVLAALLGWYLFKNSGGIMSGGSLEAQTVNIIKHFEGFYPDAYICPGGEWTIGYGHLMKEGDPDHISQSTALRWLKEELQQTYIPEARTALQGRGIDPDTLPTHQMAAIVSNVYNNGPGVVSSGTWVTHFKSGDMKLSETWYYKWSNADGVKLLGLVRRRFAEWQLITTGKWQQHPPGYQEYYDTHR